MSVSKSTTPIHCVIRHRAGIGIDARLLEALAHRSIGVATTADNSHGAFAELCKLARTGSRSNVLLVTDLTDREETAKLFRSMERYPVHGKMWIFEAGAQPELRAAHERDFAPPQAPMPKIDIHPPTAATPLLRLTDHPRPEPRPLPPEFELTDEELSALTAPPPDFKATR